MNLEELKKNLSNKLEDENNSSIRYFNSKLNAHDEFSKRRSFNDLIAHYNKFGINDKMLMQAIKELSMSGYYCPDPRRIVFFKYENDNRFWVRGTRHEINLLKNEEENFGKYTPEYLEELYDSV